MKTFSKNKPTLIHLLSAIFSLMLGCALIIAGFIIPPPGEIHNSVLVAYGETLTFVGALMGMNYNSKYKSYSSKVDDENN